MKIIQNICKKKLKYLNNILNVIYIIMILIDILYKKQYLCIRTSCIRCNNERIKNI